MESGICEFGIKREEIEIVDLGLKLQEGEEEVEDDKPFIGLDDCEFDVKVPNCDKDPLSAEILLNIKPQISDLSEHSYDIDETKPIKKELCILAKDADSCIGLKTELAETDEGYSAKYCFSDNITNNISVIGFEFSNTAQENSVTCFENNTVSEHNKKTAHTNLHTLSDTQDIRSRGSRADVLSQRFSTFYNKTPLTFSHSRTIRKKGEMAGGNRVLKRKAVSKNIGNNQDLCKKSKQSLSQKDLNFSNNLEQDNLVSSDTPYPPHTVQNDSSKSENEPVIAVKPYSCTYCDYQTCFYNLLAIHKRRHNRRQPWACSKCSYSSATKYCLLRHVALVHEKPQNIFCLECDFRCSRKTQLKNHMVVHRDKNYFQCSECDFKHVKQAVVRRHTVIHMENKFPLKCAICGYKGVKPEYVTRHMEKHHRFELDFESSFGVPEIVKENVDLNSSRDTHGLAIENYNRKIVKKQPVVLLRRCDDDIGGGGNSAVNIIKIHERVLQDNFFDVAKCGEPEIIDPESLNSLQQQDDASVIMKSTLVTKKKNIITSIVKVVDDDQSVQTQLNMWKSESGIKEKVIRQIKSKRGASISQTESNPIAINEVIYNKTNCSSKTAGIYRCNECSFVSTWLDRYETHVKLHSGDNYTCDKCDFITSSRPYLARHKRLKHCKTKNFECEKCDYKSSNSQYLKEHMKSHVKAKRLKCDKCNISCKTALTLKNHMRIHEEEKPFACDLCDFRTRFKASLMKHRFVHTGETKNVCTICNYKFYAKANLKKHMEVHGLSK